MVDAIAMGFVMLMKLIYDATMASIKHPCTNNIPTKSVFNALSNKSTLAIVVVILSDL